MTRPSLVLLIAAPLLAVAVWLTAAVAAAPQEPELGGVVIAGTTAGASSQTALPTDPPASSSVTTEPPASSSSTAQTSVASPAAAPTAQNPPAASGDASSESGARPVTRSTVCPAGSGDHQDADDESPDRDDADDEKPDADTDADDLDDGLCDD